MKCSQGAVKGATKKAVSTAKLKIRNAFKGFIEQSFDGVRYIRVSTQF